MTLRPPALTNRQAIPSSIDQARFSGVRPLLSSDSDLPRTGVEVPVWFRGQMAQAARASAIFMEGAGAGIAMDYDSRALTDHYQSSRPRQPQKVPIVSPVYSRITDTLETVIQRHYTDEQGVESFWSRSPNLRVRALISNSNREGMDNFAISMDAEFWGFEPSHAGELAQFVGASWLLNNAANRDLISIAALLEKFGATPEVAYLIVLRTDEGRPIAYIDYGDDRGIVSYDDMGSRIGTPKNGYRFSLFTDLSFRRIQWWERFFFGVNEAVFATSPDGQPRSLSVVV